MKCRKSGQKLFYKRNKTHFFAKDGNGGRYKDSSFISKKKYNGSNLNFRETLTPPLKLENFAIHPFRFLFRLLNLIRIYIVRNDTKPWASFIVENTEESDKVDDFTLR